jgi:hypothetical protein
MEATTTRSANRTAKRSANQVTRKLGKAKSGWIKRGLYLSPEANLRVMLLAIKRNKDESDILDNLVMRHIDALTITVGSNDRLDSADDVKAKDQEAA